MAIYNYVACTDPGAINKQFRLYEFNSSTGAFTLQKEVGHPTAATGGRAAIVDGAGNFYLATKADIFSYDSDLNLRTGWATGGRYTGIPGAHFTYGMAVNPADNSLIYTTNWNAVILDPDGIFVTNMAVPAPYYPRPPSQPTFLADNSEVFICSFSGAYGRVDGYNPATGVVTSTPKSQKNHYWHSLVFNAAMDRMYLAETTTFLTANVAAYTFPAMGFLWAHNLASNVSSRPELSADESLLYIGGEGGSVMESVNASTGALVDTYNTGTTGKGYAIASDGTLLHYKSAVGTNDQDGDAGDFRSFTAGLVKTGFGTEGDAPYTVVFGTVIPLSIDSQSASQTVTHDVPMVLEVVVSGSDPKTYQWKLDGDDITGETASTYTVATPVTATVGTYTCEISNPHESITSADIVIKVAPYITAQPTPTTEVRAGNALELTVVGGGGPGLAYQWNLNGTPIAGATSATYSVLHVAEGSGGDYTCVLSISGDPSTATSDAANVTVLPSLTGLVQRMFDIPIDNDMT